MGWAAAPIPADDKARVQALGALEILDTAPEEDFDAIVKLAAEICGVPIALVSLVDESRQWFKAKVGVTASETERATSYCGHAIMNDETMIVPDASQDPRFVDNPFRVGDPHVEFYAGVPLRMSSGHKVGTLCIIDHKPRFLTLSQHAQLEALAAQVVRLLELRRAALLSRDTVATLKANDEALRKGESNELATTVPRWSLAAFALACLLGCASLAASLWVHSTVKRSGAERLARAAERASNFLAERGDAYGQILRGAGALFRASEHVSADEFTAYAASLQLQRNYPGLLGLGYSERVARSELAAWLAATRMERPDFALLTSGTAPELSINKFIEPRSANQAAIGFDLLSEPVRARALNHAAVRNDLTLSESVHLLQDESRAGPGYLMYLPVPDRDHPALAPRGFVFAALRGREMVDGIQRVAGADVSLRIRDGQNGPSLLEANANDELGVARVPVRMADRTFLLEARPGASFYDLAERTEPWAVLVLGLATTLLAFGLTRAVGRTEARSRSIAKRMTDALRRGERELRAVVEGTTDLIITIGEDGRLLFTNGAFRRLLGHDEKVAAIMSISDVVEPKARAAFESALAAGRSIAGTLQVETIFRARSGDAIEVEGVLSFERLDNRPIARAIFRDVTVRRQGERALRAANEALERIAATDALTGVANRRVFDERLSSEVSRRLRSGGDLSLALIDVDCFKLYNDTYGHQQGDECLKYVATALAQCARRAGEVAARYGGEEFALLLPGSNESAASELANQLRERIEALSLVHVSNPRGVVTVSVGVATFDTSAMGDGRDLLAAADAALYRAKKAGRNRVERAA